MAAIVRLKQPWEALSHYHLLLPCFMHTIHIKSGPGQARSRTVFDMARTALAEVAMHLDRACNFLFARALATPEDPKAPIFMDDSANEALTDLRHSGYKSAAIASCRLFL